MFLDGSVGDPAAGLGRAVALPDAASGGLLPPPHHLVGQMLPPGHAEDEAAEVVLVEALVCEEHPVERRCAEERRDPVLVDVGQDGFQVHLGQQHQTVAGENGSQAHRLTQDVVEGRPLQDDIPAPGDAGLAQRPLGVQALEQVQVRERHSLGTPVVPPV